MNKMARPGVGQGGPQRPQAEWRKSPRLSWREKGGGEALIFKCGKILGIYLFETMKIDFIISSFQRKL